MTEAPTRSSAQTYAARVRRPIRPVLAVLPMAMLGQMSATGCSCDDVNCAGAAVYVDLGPSNEANAARICIDGKCETVPRSLVGLTELSFDAVPVTVGDDEDFELTIAVLGDDGAELATITETRNFDVAECRCLSFQYEWDRGSQIERSQ